ncbi:MAG: ThiF family adenylyltransferase [Vicingaceae bacterium]
MSQQLISHNEDLKKLRDEGYHLEICGGQLIAHHIPYVNSKKEVKLGSLVCPLSLSGQTTVKPNNHVINFSGEHPCDHNGNIIKAIQYRSMKTRLPNGLETNFSFSNKPKGGYPDYYEKVKRYAEIISAPAISLDNSVTAKPFKVIESVEENLPFKYYDTNSSRANIENVTQKLESQKIAIVGLGGTGSYILDLVSKTCVDEIHLFDGDYFLNHNAFRSPSACSIEELSKKPKKVDYYFDIYSRLKNNIVPHETYLSEENLHELGEFDFVFLCVDDNEARALCIHYLVSIKKPFVDVGLGINLVNDQLIGTTRVTLGTKDMVDHIEKRVPRETEMDNEYKSNIQIVELNALNAVQAVIKWKKHFGFYQDLVNEYHSTYSINDSLLLNEECYGS